MIERGGKELWDRWKTVALKQEGPQVMTFDEKGEGDFYGLSVEEHKAIIGYLLFHGVLRDDKFVERECAESKLRHDLWVFLHDMIGVYQ